MKIRNINIEHAYFGNLELNNDNAFIGIYPVIEKPYDGPLRFAALENGHIGMSHGGTNTTTTIPKIEYSRDGINWNEWFFETINVNKGQHIYFRGDNYSIGKYSSSQGYGWSTFTGSGKFNIDGHLTSLLGENRTPITHAFYELFQDNNTIINANKLKIDGSSYGIYAFFAMFRNCQNLKSAPELLANYVSQGTFSHMFYNCTSLQYPPSILPAPFNIKMNNENGTFDHMFYGCSSLQEAPILMQQKNEKGGRMYDNMFENCTSLSKVTTYFNDTERGEYAGGYKWLKNVAPVGEIYCLANVRFGSDPESGVPTGWTRIDL